MGGSKTSSVGVKKAKRRRKASSRKGPMTRTEGLSSGNDNIEVDLVYAEVL